MAADPGLRPGRFRGVTWRSVLLGTILIPLNALWLAERAEDATTISLLFNVVFIVGVLLVLNRVVVRFRPSSALCQAEFLVIYTMLAIATTLCAVDSAAVLLPIITMPFHYANDTNNWRSLFWKYLPRWLTVRDKTAVKAFYAGSSTLYVSSHYAPWIQPALWWSLFSVVLLFIMLCINTLLRKQWTENERLSYPIVQLPLEMTRDAELHTLAPLFRNRIFWVGFVLALFVDLVNSLNLYYPSIPTIFSPGFGVAYYDLAQFFKTKPWNAIGWMPATWYPFVIGLGMMLPLDFLFSIWFFYLFWKLEQVVVVALAWDSDPLFPYIQEQSFGGYMAFLLFAVVLVRGYLKQVLLCALGRFGPLDDSREPMRYRQAIAGILLGMAFLVAFSTAAGMSPWYAIAFFIIYFALAIAITRMRAELGTPIHDLHFTGPDWMLAGLIGSRNIGHPTLAIFSLYFWFNRAYRNMTMPHQLEGLKLAERTGVSFRRMAFVMIYSSLLAAPCGIWAMLHKTYADPPGDGWPWLEAWSRLAHWLQSPAQTNVVAIGAAAAGLVICVLLQLLRIRFSWWPFHPLAFAVTSSWQINLVWLPMLLAWIFKSLILRYGGRRGYARSMPFFFGLMLGQFSLGGVLYIFGAVTHVPVYTFGPL